MTVPTRPFGPQGTKVPIVGQGTWNMEADDPERVREALRRGIELGLTHVDTAELYGAGEVERIISDVVVEHREKLFLASKVLPSNASRKGTVAACEASLRRLRTDRLDLYLLHWPGAHPLEETIAGFEELVRAGKIRAWGVSNFDVAELEEAIALAGEGRIACNQVLYHLKERHIEAELMPLCARHGIAVVGYSPFGSGDFPTERSRGGKVLAEIAQAHGATARQVALAFLVRQPGTFVIPKASKVAHVEDNARAASLRLDADDLRRIDAAFPLKVHGSLPVI